MQSPKAGKDPIKILIGADPEVFLESNISHNIRSAIGLIGGSKIQPLPLSRTGFFVQEDNVAVEFNIPPAKTVDEFVESIQWSIKALSNKANDLGLSPRISASELFPEPELQNPQAMEFGCEPDYNAWNSGNRNTKPYFTVGQLQRNLRSCGGHIHVSMNYKYSALDMVKAMDLFLGVPSVMMDEDTGRRQLYGKAGAFRPTKYDNTSWEYRVLSNFWIKTPGLCRWAYEQTLRAIDFVVNTTSADLHNFFVHDALGLDIQQCINQSNVDLSHHLIHRYNLTTAA